MERLNSLKPLQPRLLDIIIYSVEPVLHGIEKQIKMPKDPGKENNDKKGLAGPNSVCPRDINPNKTGFEAWLFISWAARRWG